jgi:ubiquinone/menaquinone biosynthesis C-methylase UbiE
VDARLQRRVQRYGWDRAAEAYDDFWAEQLRPSQTRLLELAGVKPGERVLDIACGTGLVSMPVARLVGPTGAVVGTDLSEGMLAAARELAARLGLANADFERMDAERLDLPDGAFDVALCALGLMYVPDVAASLAEMRRVVKPGGRAAALVWGERARCGWAEIFPIVDARVATEVCPLFFRLGTGDVLARAFEAAGFDEVRTERLDVPLHYATDAEACGAAFDGGPVALAWSRFDELSRAEARAAYLASIQPYRNGGGYQIPGEFVIVTGKKGTGAFSS